MDKDSHFSPQPLFLTAPSVCLVPERAKLSSSARNLRNSHRNAHEISLTWPSALLRAIPTLACSPGSATAAAHNPKSLPPVHTSPGTPQARSHTYQVAQNLIISHLVLRYAPHTHLVDQDHVAASCWTRYPYRGLQAAVGRRQLCCAVRPGACNYAHD